MCKKLLKEGEEFRIKGGMFVDKSYFDCLSLLIFDFYVREGRWEGRRDYRSIMLGS